VPPLAIAIGAHRAAAEARGKLDATVLGVASGAVFAILVALSVVVSTVSVQVEGPGSEATSRLALGALPIEAGLYALAWGVTVGGFAGVVSFAVKGSRPTPA
jgi:hypothetical protein